MTQGAATHKAGPRIARQQLQTRFSPPSPSRPSGIRRTPHPAALAPTRCGHTANLEASGGIRLPRSETPPLSPRSSPLAPFRFVISLRLASAPQSPRPAARLTAAHLASAAKARIPPAACVPHVSRPRARIVCQNCYIRMFPGKPSFYGYNLVLVATILAYDLG